MPVILLKLILSGKLKAGRIQAGGVMYDDTGAIVSEVVLKDRIHMSQRGYVCSGTDSPARYGTY